MLKECKFENIVKEANKDIDNLNQKIEVKVKENECLAFKLEKLIEIKYEIEKEKEKENTKIHNTNHKYDNHNNNHKKK